MKIAKIFYNDVANGPGVRTSVFVSGCRRHCPGCHNLEAQSFEYGEEYTDEVKEKILFSLKHDEIQGISFLGGEPFEPENEKELVKLAKLIKAEFPDKDIWVWSGWLYENLKDRELLSVCDVLVDGPYIEDEKDMSLAYAGSRNQRVINLKRT